MNRPVKVTAWLSSGVCNHVPMLDSLLCAEVGKHMSRIRESRHGSRHTGPDRNGWENIPIPIASAPIGGWRVPLCSSPIYRTIGEDVAHVSRVAEFDVDAIRAGRASKVNVTAGAHKGMRLPKRVITTGRVVWFAVSRVDGGRKQTGAMSRLRKRLKKIGAIGAKTSIGFGRVSEWSVESVAEDWSWYSPSANGTVLMRPLPVCNELPDDLCGFKRWFDRPAPPYHDKSTACEVVTPC